MKLLFTLLLLAGGLTTFAQNKIDGNWKGTRDTKWHVRNQLHF
jgi:hypothetical protein